MDNKLLKDFLAEQTKLINATAHAKPAHKDIIRPERSTTVVDVSDPEAMYNHIIEKKPAHKKVVKFLQECIDHIMSDEE